MAKIIQIDGDTVVIGNDDGSIKEVKVSDCVFTPHVGDEVEVFSMGEQNIVNKVGGEDNDAIAEDNTTMKIIQIAGDKIFLGNDSGKMKEVLRTDCSFEPQIGDEVEIFTMGTQNIVTKINQPSEEEGDPIEAAATLLNLSVQTEKVIVGQYNKIYEGINDFVAELGYTPIDKNINQGIVTFKTPVNMTSWAHIIQVIFTKSDDNVKVVVTGKTDLPIPTYDWGQKKKIADNILTYLEAYVSSKDKGELSQIINDSVQSQKTTTLMKDKFKKGAEKIKEQDIPGKLKVIKDIGMKKINELKRPDPLKTLEQLHHMKESGVLSEEEYEQQKKKILNNQ